MATEQTDGACSPSFSSAGFGFTVGQEVTVTRRLWEPADEHGPGGLLALPGDRLIVRAIRERGQFPISVSHHDRTDGMTFQVTPDELKPNVKSIALSLRILPGRLPFWKTWQG